MCKDGDTVTRLVKIPADLSSTGKERWKDALIDSCIAPIVTALQGGGVDMRGSCCGHDLTLGHIDLQDGRGLLILTPDQNRMYLTHLLNIDGDKIKELFDKLLKEKEQRYKVQSIDYGWEDEP